MDTKEAIITGNTSLGIELGSTRIKAVLIDDRFLPVASGSYDWENQLEDGVWTYSLEDVWAGLQSSFRQLAETVLSRYGTPLVTVGAIGISAMMHGYLAFGEEGPQSRRDGLLVPFRTWRNTMTEQAAAELTGTFAFNIPQRWSIAHLYQAILNREPHVKDITFLTTLAGYVHWKLSGKKVLGVGDGSGMFPIDSGTNNYNERMLEQFNALVEGAAFGWKLRDILPTILNAGEDAGTLTEAGARLLDPTGRLKPGIPLCPPEGDAGTGMVATNSVAERTGNISAGTSVFAMVVLEKDLSRVYPEIDMVTTPTGKPVAMVHCNNGTSDLDAWVRMFGEVLGLFGQEIEKPALYDALYYKAVEGESDCGGLLSYNYYAGEPITGIEQGRPLLVRTPGSRLNLANFMRTLLYATMGTLKLGMDLLTEQEQVRLDRLLGHGGLFKTGGVGQRLVAAALEVPVAVMDGAGEGGAWGIALLAAYRHVRAAGQAEKESLETFLQKNVFSGQTGTRLEPDPKDAAGFKAFMERYTAGLEIERAAVKCL
ncbi:MAG: FGGY-family carbohydrate kinase [Treponema sp.]|jgi:sugar (pentulose or hexulose) kinase|nr:FGGY-family carbohydrate kinase [Treponema sp.]